MNLIPRYVYTPKRLAPQAVSEDIMEQVRQLYVHPISRPRDVRPVSQVVAEGLDQVRSFRGRKV